MATVISLTEDKIKELLSGWEGVALSQDQINALVAQLWTSQATVDAKMDDLQSGVIPILQQDVAASSVRVDDLNDNVVPTMQLGLEQAQLILDNLNTVDLPSLRADLEATSTNVRESPKVYVQTEEPTNPDDQDRYLVVGDMWHDSDDNNRQRIWNGVEWTTFNVDVADFSLTVRKFLSSTHQIY